MRRIEINLEVSIPDKATADVIAEIVRDETGCQIETQQLGDHRMPYTLFLTAARRSDATKAMVTEAKAVAGGAMAMSAYLYNDKLNSLTLASVSEIQKGQS